MPELTSDELDRLEALAAKATPAPWTVIPRDGPPFYGGGDVAAHDGILMADGARVLLELNHAFPRLEEDRAFIAEARTALPRLVTALRVAREAHRKLGWSIVHNARHVARYDMAGHALWRGPIYLSPLTRARE